MSASVISVKYATLRGRDDITGLREYEAVYTVECDSPYDGPKIARSASGVPNYPSYWRTATESDVEAILTGRDCEADPENTYIYYITCTYSTAGNSAAGQAGQGGVSPEVKEINLAPELEWDFVERNVVQYTAFEAILYEGNRDITPQDMRRPKGAIPIVNSARDFFDPPLEEENARLVLKFTRAIADYNPLLAFNYANVLNSDYFLGLPPKTILLKPIKAKAVFDKGLAYWRISAEMHIRFDGWYHDIWDAGMREFITAADIENGGKKFEGKEAGYNHIKNAEGTFVTEPVLLDGQGHALAIPGNTKAIDFREQTPCIWRYRTKAMLPFASMPYLMF